MEPPKPPTKGKPLYKGQGVLYSEALCFNRETSEWVYTLYRNKRSGLDVDAIHGLCSHKHVQ